MTRVCEWRDGVPAEAKITAVETDFTGLHADLYPGLMYIVSIEAKRCVDLRNSKDEAVLEQVLAAMLDTDDLSAS